MTEHSTKLQSESIALELETATGELAQASAIRDSQRGKLEATREARKKVALSAALKDPSALKAQKSARQEHEDAEFALEEAELAVQGAHEKISGIKMRLAKQKVREAFAEMIVIGDRRVKLLQRVGELGDQLSAIFSEFSVAGAELRSNMARADAALPTYRTGGDIVGSVRLRDVVDGAVREDKDRLVNCLKMHLPHEVRLRLQENFLPTDAPALERGFWEWFASESLKE